MTVLRKAKVEQGSRDMRSQNYCTREQVHMCIHMSWAPMIAKEQYDKKTSESAALGMVTP